MRSDLRGLFIAAALLTAAVVCWGALLWALQELARFAP
jgi:hypothetical protein